MMFSVGLGYDIHELVKDRKLILGGVEIPHYLGLLGHSDADVILHAVCDAILGAACMPDIGHLFPNTDERFKGASSIDLLKEVCRQVGERPEGYTVHNIDIMVICEKPKIFPHIEAMKKNITDATGCRRISIKATTAEKMNDEGREKCISAQAVCLLNHE